MRMTSRDGSLELFGDYRRGSDRKPPRPHSRRRRYASEDVRRSSSRRLTTFQKLDREMGKFVRAQTVMRQGGSAKEACLMQVSEEDSSVRGVRHGVKWKCGWMFEQDSLYWETVRRQDVSGGEERDSWRRAQGRLDAGKGKELRERGDGSKCDSSSALDYDGALRQHCSTDHESVSSGMELHLRRTHASRKSRREEPRCARGQKSFTDHERKARDQDDKSMPPKIYKGWPAVLQAKCEVLQMEKELADQRLQQQCAEMAQAAEMAHCLRASVQTILETAKRGTVSAPCTPGRHVEANLGLQQRIEQLQTVNMQRDLEDQAKSFQNRIEKLRLKSQVRSADSSFRKDLVSKTRLSSTSSTTQVLTSDGEDWAQVQEVLKQLRGKTGSLQHNCENWEKRAIFAESKASSLELEEEKWRVEAQRSEEKVRELERELVQVRATLEEVRNRHALEQSRLLGSGSNHGYTLVLQPIVTTHGSASCKSSDCESSCMTCGAHSCHGPASAKHQQPSRLSDHQPEDALEDQPPFDQSDEITAVDESASPTSQVMPATRTPSPDGELSETIGRSRSRHRYEELEDDCEDSPKKENIPTTAGQHNGQEIAKSEVEKSLSQKWFKQRPKSRRPGTPGCELSTSETRSNLGNSPIPAQRHGAGRGLNGHSGALRKPGPVQGSSMRVHSSPSPSLVEKRVPFKEIKRSTTPNEARNTDCS